MKVKLDTIIMGMESANIETRVYYCPRTNDLKYYGDYFENEDDEEDFDDDLIALPDQYDIHEYKMMQDFIETIEDVKTYNLLASAIRGKGAFRHFKDTAHILGVIDEWYTFRDKAYKQKAIEWCNDHNIEYEE